MSFNHRVGTNDIKVGDWVEHKTFKFLDPREVVRLDNRTFYVAIGPDREMGPLPKRSYIVFKARQDTHKQEQGDG